MRKTHLQLSFFFFFMVLLCVGCSVNSNTATSTPSPPTQTPFPTFTYTPSVTPLPTQTKLPTQAAAVTGTPYPTPAVDFTKATFYTAGFLPGWRFFIAIQADEEIKGSYIAIIQDDKGKAKKQYSCTVIPNYPKRVYCSGDLPGMEKWFNYTLIDQTSNQPVFSGRVFIPLFQRYRNAP